MNQIIDTPPYVPSINLIESLDFENGITPPIYWASLLQREHLEQNFEWKNVEANEVIDTKKRIENFLANQDLKNSVFWVLTFPHVTTIGRFSNHNYQSNMPVGLYNTQDMSKNPNVIVSKNEFSVCGLETDIMFLEKNLWFASQGDYKDYYAINRINALSKLYELGNVFCQDLKQLNKF